MMMMIIVDYQKLDMKIDTFFNYRFYLQISFEKMDIDINKNEQR